MRYKYSLYEDDPAYLLITVTDNKGRHQYKGGMLLEYVEELLQRGDEIVERLHLEGLRKIYSVKPEIKQIPKEAVKVMMDSLLDFFKRWGAIEWDDEANKGFKEYLREHMSMGQ